MALIKMAGYSPNPLWKKLGYKPGLVIHLHQPPADYRTALALPAEVEVNWAKRLEDGVPFVHAFVREYKELASLLPIYRDRLARDGAIWISWPKKASRVATDITEDRVREAALPLGLVDIKVCAVDETWSGLKLVIRKTLR
jgi:hypothetical protein